MLMLSIGMSLSPRRLLENWGRLTPSLWVRLVAGTFLLPPLLALALGGLIPLGGPATAGLFLIAVVPGAPLMTRGAAQKGFDLQLAASYQVWGALLTPVIVPWLIASGGWLYGREIWVPPMKLLAIIAEQQFVPLIIGMTLMWLAPAFSTRAQRILNMVGNILLLVVLVGLLCKIGAVLWKESLWVVVAALLLATGCAGDATAAGPALRHGSHIVRLQCEPARRTGAPAFRTAKQPRSSSPSDRGLRNCRPAGNVALRKVRSPRRGEIGGVKGILRAHRCGQPKIEHVRTSHRAPIIGPLSLAGAGVISQRRRIVASPKSWRSSSSDEHTYSWPSARTVVTAFCRRAVPRRLRRRSVIESHEGTRQVAVYAMSPLRSEMVAVLRFFGGGGLAVCVLAARSVRIDGNEFVW